MKYFFNILFVMMAGLVIFSSCKKDDDTAAKQAEIDEQIIVDYLAANNITATRDDSGLYYLITNEGSGDQPTANSSVEVYYKGYFTDGSVFDQTTQGPVSFSLQGLITGWQIGIPLMKEGGKATFYVPSALGYGANGAGSVPGNAVIIFEIDLIGVL